MARHTSGPWEVDWGTGAIETPTGGAIAYVAQHGNVNTITRTGETFSGADARLIAAAPELLQVAHMLLPRLVHAEACESMADDGLGSRLRQLRRDLDFVRAAISKAEGRS